MPGNIVIIRKKRQKLTLKMTKKIRAGYAPDHKISINLWDFKDVSLMLHDLKELYNVPIDKAILEYQKGRSKNWPF